MQMRRAIQLMDRDEAAHPQAILAAALSATYASLLTIAARYFFRVAYLRGERENVYRWHQVTCRILFP